MHIRLVEAELFQANGQTDRHDEANIRFRNLRKVSKRERLKSHQNSPRNPKSVLILDPSSLFNICGRQRWRQYVTHKCCRLDEKCVTAVSPTDKVLTYTPNSLAKSLFQRPNYNLKFRFTPFFTGHADS